MQREEGGSFTGTVLQRQVAGENRMSQSWWITSRQEYYLNLTGLINMSSQRLHKFFRVSKYAKILVMR